jgi:hypothetical protein
MVTDMAASLIHCGHISPGEQCGRMVADRVVVPARSAVYRYPPVAGQVTDSMPSLAAYVVPGEQWAGRDRPLASTDWLTIIWNCMPAASVMASGENVASSSTARIIGPPPTGTGDGDPAGDDDAEPDGDDDDVADDAGLLADGVALPQADSVVAAATAAAAAAMVITEILMLMTSSRR